MSDANLIGKGSCPVCGSEKARFTLSKKDLACMTCNGCNIQIFARSDNSDQRLRSFIKAAASVAEPVAPIEAEKTNPPAVPAADIPKPKPAPVGWGFMGAFNA